MKPAPPFWQGRLLALIYDMQNQRTATAEKVRRDYLFQCYLRKQQTTTTTTTPAPQQPAQPVHQTYFPDYSDFSFFQDKHVVSHPDTAKHNISKRHAIPQTANTDTDINTRQKRQILAAIGAIGGVLCTILGIFNQQEIHNILNHVSKLETNQNLLIRVAHKNAKSIQN